MAGLTTACVAPATPECRTSALFAAALRHHEAGRLADAEQGYRRVLAADPRHADSLHLLGVAAHQAGRHAEAIALIRQAIGLRDDVALYHNNLAEALLAAGGPAEAAAACRQALSLEPGFAPAHRSLANALMAQNDVAAAVTQYRQAIDLQPEDAEAHNNLGCALQRLGRLAEAAACLRRALALSPGHAEIHCNLGRILAEDDQPDEAVAAYGRAIALRPDFAAAYGDLGCVLRDQGAFDAAGRAFERAIALAPRCGQHYRNLLNLRQVTPGDPAFAALEAVARDMAALPEQDRIELHFACGKAYADLGQPARGFEHLLQGNALKRHGLVYDEAAMLGFFDRIRSVFTAALLRGGQGQGQGQAREHGQGQAQGQWEGNVHGQGQGRTALVPVFIVGMPRSGSTLVEQILAGHPHVRAAGEREALPLAVARLRAGPGAALAFPEAVPELSAAALRQLAADYLAELPATAPGERCITDKMPSNSCFLGLICLALPQARIIHVSRDPVDTCLSCFATLFGPPQPFSYELGELGRYYRGHAGLMAHWRDVLPRGVMLEVRYEDVVADLERQARRIVAHCGLAWDSACLAFDRAQRPVRTSSAWQVRQPIYRSSIGRWRPDRDVLQPLLDALGADQGPVSP